MSRHKPSVEAARVRRWSEKRKKEGKSDAVAWLYHSSSNNHLWEKVLPSASDASSSHGLPWVSHEQLSLGTRAAGCLELSSACLTRWQAAFFLCVVVDGVSFLFYCCRRSSLKTDSDFEKRSLFFRAVKIRNSYEYDSLVKYIARYLVCIGWCNGWCNGSCYAWFNACCNGGSAVALVDQQLQWLAFAVVDAKV